METKKNSITDDYTISQTVLGLGINGKGGLISEGVLISVKGQLISKCLFGAILSTKKTTEFIKNFALASKKRSNERNKSALLY